MRVWEWGDTGEKKNIHVGSGNGGVSGAGRGGVLADVGAAYAEDAGADPEDAAAQHNAPQGEGTGRRAERGMGGIECRWGW